MSHGRTFFIGALCAIAVPAAALGVELSRAGATSAPRGVDAGSEARAERRPGREARPAPQARSGEQVVNTRVTREVGNGCTYAAGAEGLYRTDGPGGARDGHLRDVDLAAASVLVCNGEVVRASAGRIELPQAEAHDIASLMNERLALEVPGSHCIAAGVFEYEQARLQARGVTLGCPSGERGGPGRGIGGGPRPGGSAPPPVLPSPPPPERPNGRGERPLQIEGVYAPGAGSSL